MTTMKAAVTDVSIGSITIEGVMLPDGTFGVTASQANALLKFSCRQENVLRVLKPLLGEGSELIKATHPTTKSLVDILTLEQFTTVVKDMALDGYNTAGRFLRSMAGLSLHQLFSDAFSAKLEADERSFADRIQQYMGHKPDLDYGRCTLDIYRLAGVSYDSTGHNFRDTLDEEQLRKVEFVEEAIARLMANGKDYQAAVIYYKSNLALTCK